MAIVFPPFGGSSINLQSALTLKGVWDASTNTPVLADGVGTNGDMYLVNVAGATVLDGHTDWKVGDFAVFIGEQSLWEKLDEQLTEAEILAFVEKTNNATGYSLAGGTTTKTLTVTEDSTIDQNLSTGSNVSFLGIRDTNLGTASYLKSSGGTITAGVGTVYADSSSGTTIGLRDFRVLGTGSSGVRWVSTGGTVQAHMHRFGASDGRLLITNSGGSNTTGQYLASGTNFWQTASDYRLKTNIKTYTGVLDKIKDKRTITYNPKKTSADEETGKEIVSDDYFPVVNYGIIAQEWQSDFPNLITGDEESGYLGASYAELGVIAMQAVIELTKKVDDLKKELDDLKND